jgi:uncharacterized membrane protein YfcA
MFEHASFSGGAGAKPSEKRSSFAHSCLSDASIMDTNTIALAAITLLAATVNGALGYGFSSITVPVALFFLTNRVLNPALVPIEVVLNAYVLWVNRRSIPAVWRRTVPIVIALAPGVAVGTMMVRR